MIRIMICDDEPKMLSDIAEAARSRWIGTGAVSDLGRKGRHRMGYVQCGVLHIHNLGRCADTRGSVFVSRSAEHIFDADG